MPRKRTRSKRHDLRAEYDAWESIFDCGIDFFDELSELGIPTDTYGRPLRDCAEAAWRRHGGAYLATHSRELPSGRGLIWALEQFGEPQCLQSA